jgi:hypothetical protein
MNRVTSIFLVILALAASVSLAEEQCPADKAWFAASGTPKPPTSEPKRGDDCAFYQRAWQTFLYVTATTGGKPRFLKYSSFAQVFGPDTKIGLLPDPAPSHMVLAPRLKKHGQAADTCVGEGDVTQAGSETILLDQKGHPIFYNIIMNPEFEAFVRAQQFNKLATLKVAKPALELPVGAVELKAAWQIVDGASPPPDRIIAQADVPRLFVNNQGQLTVDKNAGVHTVTVALIALHVVMRTKGHPEMIWATFEYDRNAPSTKGNPKVGSNCVNGKEPFDDVVVDDGGDYELYKKGFVANRIPEKFKEIDLENQVFDALKPDEHISIVRIFPFSNCSLTHDKDSAVTEIDGAIVAVNESAKGQLKDARRNKYSLVGAVWLDEPRNPNESLSFAENRGFETFELGGERRLSSVAMESFTQLDSQNCFACHDTSRKGDLDAKRLNVSHIFKRFSTSKEPAKPASPSASIIPCH